MTQSLPGGELTQETGPIKLHMLSRGLLEAYPEESLHKKHKL